MRVYVCVPVTEPALGSLLERDLTGFPPQSFVTCSVAVSARSPGPWKQQPHLVVGAVLIPGLVVSVGRF